MLIILPSSTEWVSCSVRVWAIPVSYTHLLILRITARPAAPYFTPKAFRRVMLRSHVPADVPAACHLPQLSLRTHPRYSFHHCRGYYSVIWAWFSRANFSCAADTKCSRSHPVMDSWNVLRTIRQDSKTPVIMLTAKGETNDQVQGLKQGADDYPVSYTHLSRPRRVRSSPPLLITRPLLRFMSCRAHVRWQSAGKIGRAHV